MYLNCVYCQVKELGAVVTNCSSLVDDASKLFEVYWYLGQPNTPIPDPWPSQYDTEYNVTSPMKVQLNGTDSLVFLSVSMSACCLSRIAS